MRLKGMQTGDSPNQDPSHWPGSLWRSLPRTKERLWRNRHDEHTTTTGRRCRPSRPLALNKNRCTAPLTYRSVKSGTRGGAILFHALLLLSSTAAAALAPPNEINISRRDALERAAAQCVGALTFATTAATFGADFAHAKASPKKTVTEIYDAASDSYDSLYSGSRMAAALDFDGIRRSNFAPASGRVLELGVGTGLNLPRYPADGAVKSLTGVDVSTGMLARAKERADMLPPGVDADFAVADASDLPFEEKTFDAVADTFSLCVFEEPRKVLAEARRVLKPGGLLLITETDGTAASRLLGWTNAFLANDVARTCRANDDVLGLVRGAGFDVVETEVVGGGVFRRVVGRRAR